MENHPEITSSKVTRQAIEDKVKKRDRMDELTAGSELINRMSRKFPQKSTRVHTNPLKKSCLVRAQERSSCERCIPSLLTRVARLLRKGP